MCFVYSRPVKTRPYSRTSWSSVPWNSRSSAGNSTWGNRPPPKGSQSVNKSTEWTWPWLTDGLSQRHIPVESTIHFTLSTHTPPHTQTTHTHTHASPLYTSFFCIKYTSQVSQLYTIHFTLTKCFPTAVIQILCTHTFCTSLFFITASILLLHTNVILKI